MSFINLLRLRWEGTIRGRTLQRSTPYWTNPTSDPFFPLKKEDNKTKMLVWFVKKPTSSSMLK